MKSTYKEPNRKAPRFRRTANRALNQDFIFRIRKEYPDLVISRKDVREVLNIFHALCRELIANTRDGIELPEQLGRILLGKCKVQDFKPTDHVKSQQYNTQIDYTNYNTNEWVCKVYYTNFANKYRFKNARFWGFEAGRELKKEVSKAFVKNPNKYVISDKYSRINKIYREAKKRLIEKLNNQENS